MIDVQRMTNPHWTIWRHQTHHAGRSLFTINWLNAHQSQLYTWYSHSLWVKEPHLKGSQSCFTTCDFGLDWALLVTAGPVGYKHRKWTGLEDWFSPLPVIMTPITGKQCLLHGHFEWKLDSSLRLRIGRSTVPVRRYRHRRGDGWVDCCSWCWRKLLQ